MIRATTITTRCIALLATLLALAPATALAQDAATLAHQRFLRGLALHDAHRYDEALEEFRGSYALHASPNSRLYIARTLRDLGRLPEAVAEYETAVAEAVEHARSDPRYEATREASQAELRTLDPAVGRVVLRIAQVPQNARVRVAGRVVPPAALALPVPVAPGSVTVIVEADGYTAFRREVSVPGGQRVELVVSLGSMPAPGGEANASVATVPAAATTTSPSSDVLASSSTVHRASPAPVLRALGITSLALGGVGLVSFAVLAPLTQGHFDALVARCAGSCPEGERAAIATGRTLEVLTNASIVLGVTAATVGIGLLVFAPRTERAVRVSVGPGALVLQGAF